jgi:hypothetical protein
MLPLLGKARAMPAAPHCPPLLRAQIKASKFCLAPYGHGWGVRTNIYMAHGCVPVIVQVGAGGRGALAALARRWRRCGARAPACHAAARRRKRAALCPRHWLSQPAGRLLRALNRLLPPHLLPPQDHVYQPYESILPYQEFSVRLAKSDIPKASSSPRPHQRGRHAAPNPAVPATEPSGRLCHAQIGDILRNVSDSEYQHLRRNLAKYYGAFVWESEGGGTAYNYTLAALRKRHQYLTASHYKL